MAHHANGGPSPFSSDEVVIGLAGGCSTPPRHGRGAGRRTMTSSGGGGGSAAQQQQQQQQAAWSGGGVPAWVPHLPPHRARSSHSLGGRVSEAPGPSYPWPQQRPATLDSVLKVVRKPLRRARAAVSGYGLLEWLQLVLPCVKWLRSYNVREFLLWDVVAGVSVGMMAIPQGLSYATLAGVPSVFGLYGLLAPCLVYSLFGSSRELAVGPVAVTSLLISSSLKEVVPGAADIANPNSPPPDLAPVQAAYNQRAVQLSLLVACMYTAVGVFNLGFLTNFLSHSVIGGFTSGAAIIIGLSQLKYILGFSVPRADRVQEQVALYIKGLPGFVWQEYVMGVALLTLLLTMKFFGKRSPRLRWLRPLGPITACAVALVAVVAGGLADRGIRIVGHIPKGLPSPTVGWWFPMDDVRRLAPLAVVVMLVDLLESTSIARALAARGKYELRANQEIVGLGLANFAGSAFNAYTTTGSFSRSAVNYDSGCKTGLAGFVTACVVALVLLFATPLFERLPLNVMGAIVISGVSGLFEYEQAVHLFMVRKLDWLVWMTSFVSTMLAGVEVGLAISIGLALLIVIYESAFPHTALLGRVGNTTIYRNVKQFPNSQVVPGIAAVRVDAPIYFANVSYIMDRVRKYLGRAAEYSLAAGVPLQFLLVDMSPVTHIDVTGTHMLEQLTEETRARGIQLGLCNPAEPVIALLERVGLPDELGRENIYVRMHEGVQHCLMLMLAHGQVVRPTSAIASAAVSPKRAAALMSSPLGRRSRGDAADTEAHGWLPPLDPACDPSSGGGGQGGALQGTVSATLAAAAAAAARLGLSRQSSGAVLASGQSQVGLLEADYLSGRSMLELAGSVEQQQLGAPLVGVGPHRLSVAASGDLCAGGGGGSSWGGGGEPPALRAPRAGGSPESAAVRFSAAGEGGSLPP